MKPVIEDVIAMRYATPAMCRLWSPEHKILLERNLWIAVMRAQRELGVNIPQEAIDACERVKEDVNSTRIAERERALRHDVKARIEEFCALAGCEHIHKGMTSRDLTDNVEQLQVREALFLLRDKAVSCLRHLRERAEALRDLPLAARTHNVVAQPTTVGRRIAMFGEELLVAFEAFVATIDRYPLRGIVGAVGTALDQLTLLGSPEKVRALNARIQEHLGFSTCLEATGQVYPRSLDFDVVSAVYRLCAGPANFARTLRLMAGAELAHEGFAHGQVGSSAMPHKINARSSERMNGLLVVLRGYLAMTAALCGDQWNEGDVSCSVVRRVALPGAFLCADGLLETFLVVLREMTVHEAMVRAELARTLPFLATTTLLMEAVRRGAGREAAHEAIRRHAVAVAQRMRETGSTDNDLAARLSKDPAFPLSASEIEAVLSNHAAFTGAAGEQVDRFVARVRAIEAQHPVAAAYAPGEIL